jgi:hypothetical protein
MEINDIAEALQTNVEIILALQDLHTIDFASKDEEEINKAIT